MIALKCAGCGRELEMHCCSTCGGELSLQTPGNDATPSRVIEQTASGERVRLHGGQGFGQLDEHFRETLAERFERADRAVSIQVEKHRLPPGCALLVLHQVADSLSDGNAQFRERLIPKFTEDAAAALLRS